MIDIKVLKTSLVDYIGEDSPEVRKFVSYVDSINRKDSKGKDLSFGMKIEDMVKLFSKYQSIGILIDGVNAVFSGYNRVFITWVGYKNKVLSVYPESEFDTQLVREDDTISFAKESGSVVYSHSIASPFASNRGIVGAYCVIKNKRGEFLETLGQDDYDKMKAMSSMGSWDKWASEFWLKSVIKRACKRHFNDVISEVDAVDNENYQLDDMDDVKASEEKKKEILQAHGHNS